jgi:hypothetical protein
VKTLFVGLDVKGQGPQKPGASGSRLLYILTQLINILSNLITQRNQYFTSKNASSCA